MSDRDRYEVYGDAAYAGPQDCIPWSPFAERLEDEMRTAELDAQEQHMSFEFNPADEDPHGECQHEIESLRQKLTVTRKALVGLVGADTKEELEQMEAAIRILPVPDVDRMNTINAIQALLQTL